MTASDATQSAPQTNQSDVSRVRRYWKISPGAGGVFWDEFVTRQVIAIGWHGSQDISMYAPTSATDLKSKIKDEGWTRSLDASYVARQFWHLYDQMRPGDGVCAYANSHVVGRGDIIGNYEYTLDGFGYRHRRKVVWRDTTPVPASLLRPALREKLQRRVTISELTQSEFEQITGMVSPLPNTTVLINRSLAGEGLQYAAWQVASFYTALQTKGFVILSGISGTGKTKLVQQFAGVMPQPRAATSLQIAAPVITVRPYMLKNGHFIIPKPAMAQLGTAMPDESRDIVVQYDGKQQSCRLYVYPAQYGMVLLILRGAAKKWFVERFSEGDRFAFEASIDADLQIVSCRLVPEDELEQADHTADSYEPRGRNWLFLSVRPDWRDSKSLLGYYNPLTGAYEWTEFLRFLERAAKSYRDGDGLAWFVLLDEMNLAHVEYYFADLLSVLESGRDAGGWTREALRLAYPDDLTVEGEVPPRELRLPPNLYVLGTVNIDETTHAFSPKVLDRAFSIELVDVDFRDYPPAIDSGAGELTDEERRTLLRHFTRDGRFARIDKREIAQYVAAHPEVREALQGLNDLLRPLTLHFGCRVFDEIVSFLVAADQNGMWEELGGYDAALDAVVLMKVLPKFHGSRAKLEAPLTAVLGWCEERGLTQTAERVRRMLGELETTGFTAFG